MPQIRLKPLSQQTIVITGASSGIGLATARRAVRAGARVLLVSRNEDGAETIVEELRGRGGQADYAVADVGDQAALQAAADKAQQVFGGFDFLGERRRHQHLWRARADAARGPEAAVRYQLLGRGAWLADRGEGAARPRRRHRQFGSVLSDRAMMLQGTYSATKHAVSAFTEALRMELERDGGRSASTLIKPSGVETASRTMRATCWTAPACACRRRPTSPTSWPAPSCMPASTASGRSWSASAAMPISLMGALFPRATDLVMEAVGYPAQVTDKRPKASTRRQPVPAARGRHGEEPDAAGGAGAEDQPVPGGAAASGADGDGAGGARRAAAGRRRGAADGARAPGARCAAAGAALCV